MQMILSVLGYFCNCSHIQCLVTADQNRALSCNNSPPLHPDQDQMVNINPRSTPMIYLKPDEVTEDEDHPSGKEKQIPQNISTSRLNKAHRRKEGELLL